MKILMVASECTPYVKVGGLADVVGALPGELARRGHDVRIVVPLYQSINRAAHGFAPSHRHLLIPVGTACEKAFLWETRLNNLVTVYGIEHRKYFDRPGVYGTADGDFADNRERFILFSRAALETAKAVNFQPDVVHCHDWQSGIVPAYLKTVYRMDSFFGRTAAVFTIHNIAYQGNFASDTIPVAGFSWQDFAWNKLEYYGRVNFMKAGIVYADALSTVSPTYAREIQAPGGGRGMEATLRSRAADLSGILNGIDRDEWNPAADPLIAAQYTAADPAGKSVCKQALQRSAGLPERADAVLFGAVSRLDPQKGYDLVARSAEVFAARQAQLVILGTGDRAIQQLLRIVETRFPQNIKVFPEFNAARAHTIYAGADAFLMPSRFEPCGLGQMISLAYGTVPVVHRTGGLADSVVNFDLRTGKGTGFVFDQMSAAAFEKALDRVFQAYEKPARWSKLRANGMAADFSWERSVVAYEELYVKAVSRKHPGA